MTKLRMAHRADVAATDGEDRSVTVTCSTETLGRDDIVMISEGIQLDRYRQNPVWLWQHNPDWPVARASTIDVIDGNLVARVTFPAEGISTRADEIYGLIRAGVINAASTGFETVEAEPIDPKRPDGGIRITKCELQEVSFVSIPACPDALVTERALEEVRRMANTSERRDPPAGAAQADIRSANVKATILKRGLYEVANLAYLLQGLGWVHNCAEFEADIENDASTVPAMIGEALKQVGAALVAMTQEEVEELLNSVDVEDEPDSDGLPEERSARHAERFRRGVARAAAKPTAPAPKTTPSPAITRSMTQHRRMASLFERELRINQSV